MSDQKLQGPSTTYSPGQVEWSTVGGGPRTDKSGVEFLNIPDGKPVNVRLIGKPYLYYRHYQPIDGISPGPQDDVAWQAGFRPGRRFCCWVLDRADGKVKLWDFGVRVADIFASYAKLGKGDPGGPSAPDWTVMVAVPDKVVDGKLQKNYQGSNWMALPGAPAPLTAEETANAIKTIGGRKLADIRAPMSAEKVGELYAEYLRNPHGPVPGGRIWRQQRYAPQQQYDPAPPQSPPVSALPKEAMGALAMDVARQVVAIAAAPSAAPASPAASDSCQLF